MAEKRFPAAIDCARYQMLDELATMYRMMAARRSRESQEMQMCVQRIEARMREMREARDNPGDIAPLSRRLTPRAGSL